MKTVKAGRASTARWMLAGVAAAALAAVPLPAQEPVLYTTAPAAPEAAEPAALGDPALPIVDAAAPDGSYGYFRVVEGEATALAASGERATAEINLPVGAGDRVSVPRGSRLEIVLPDHNLLRLDGGTDLVLTRLAGSADSGDRETRLRLIQGEVQLVVVGDALGDRLPRIDTENASVRIDDAGSYRISAVGTDWTALLVRRGSADLATRRGVAHVREDHQAVVDGGREAREADLELTRAGAPDPLERWGEQLAGQLAAVPNVDGDLQYSASSLASYGSWIEADGEAYWQPRVDDGWRPYSAGRWVSTPSGLTWVSEEPWGWVPYHYGTWDFLPDHGWVWAPGSVYSPAWVYWYWGPTYTGWCPVGYYTGFYRHRFHDPGFHSGVYGWAGGDWGSFTRWTFVDTGHVGQRHLGRLAVPGNALRDEGRLARLPQGIITTDTRGITAARWSRPREVQAVLGRGGRLPDVTPFIAREPRLPASVAHAVVSDSPAKGRLAGTPLRPAALRTPALRTLPSPALRAPRAPGALAPPTLTMQPTPLPGSPRPAIAGDPARRDRNPDLPARLALRTDRGGFDGSDVGSDLRGGQPAAALHPLAERPSPSIETALGAPRSSRSDIAIDRTERPRITNPPRQPGERVESFDPSTVERLPAREARGFDGTPQAPQRIDAAPAIGILAPRVGLPAARFVPPLSLPPASAPSGLREISRPSSAPTVAPRAPTVAMQPAVRAPSPPPAPRAPEARPADPPKHR